MRGKFLTQAMSSYIQDAVEVLHCCVHSILIPSRTNEFGDLPLLTELPAELVEVCLDEDF